MRQILTGVFLILASILFFVVFVSFPDPDAPPELAKRDQIYAEISHAITAIGLTFCLVGILQVGWRRLRSNRGAAHGSSQSRPER